MQREFSYSPYTKDLHFQEWGEGDPLIALHPLALESTAFAGVARQFEQLGFRTLAADLPGFGRTPAPEGSSLTPGLMADAVISMARGLEKPPIVLGMSMGGRVALEVALRAPESIRGAVMVAPFLPWQSYRWALEYASILKPHWAYKVPIERAWPLLQHAADLLDTRPGIEHDWLARAAVRVVYYASCPATREAFLSAAREMALDPATGPRGVWTRLPTLEVPSVFLWAGRDAIIPRDHSKSVAAVAPRIPQLEVSCSGHFVSGVHFHCMENAMRAAVELVLDQEEEPVVDVISRPLSFTPCVAKEAQRRKKPSTTKKKKKATDAGSQPSGGLVTSCLGRLLAFLGIASLLGFVEDEEQEEAEELPRDDARQAG